MEDRQVTENLHSEIVLKGSELVSHGIRYIPRTITKKVTRKTKRRSCRTWEAGKQMEAQRSSTSTEERRKGGYKLALTRSFQFLVRAFLRILAAVHILNIVLPFLF